jgi:hypothetical protein
MGAKRKSVVFRPWGLGGSRQRLDEPDPLPSKPDSHLYAFLINLFFWGFISAKMVNQIARNAEADGLDHPQVRQLAALGTEGAHTSNIFRDLCKVAQPGHLERSLGLISVPIKFNPVPAVCWPQHILDPHAVFLICTITLRVLSKIVCVGAISQISAAFGRKWNCVKTRCT